MKIGIVWKEDSDKARDYAKQASEYIRSKGQVVLEEDNLEGADYIVTFGGDGTLIHKACEHAHLGVPFIGINTGNLGFLTACESTGWQEAIDEILAGKVFVSERMSLQAKVGDKLFRAVNEVAVKGLYRVVGLKINIKGQDFLNILGDGVIVAGQTGSTAYSLSAGGPIVDPELDCFLLTPINSIGLPIPSVILASSDTISISIEKGENVSLIIDGQEHTKLESGAVVEVKKGENNIKFGYFDKNHFLKALHAKFGLGSRTKD
jgi:NAD+ kinase